ncbi:bifunctional phosphopantothenoylcysteine decarboxylase/phosphopantothenate--cysteine ligase CoaBC [Desulfovibrio sp.]|uniref:bifunctional phosphopantothenoylcysteine decarboxylase/phosphopantothenate--cysteine ligase CoaBC n=1 Tax=Desulfovibrio sp. TaxID=885 RepID=UPI0023BB72AD|nr:bifunctional phosphopantothenoylcysteine decarboxylase/phosphopantothenate--cysteine ligase CoaBC [Desulfovibrio sp.]MDE7240713.1 bifunctional phosphopantothenoylcysteine decarboxylase/phosphopantothenate--cysteine ligase CoaBC [Desulfovibrio sp.]
MNALWADTPFTDSGKFPGRRLHLGVSGSVACYKAAELLRAWRRLEMEVTATLTAGAREFVTPLLFASLGAAHVYGDMFAPGGDVFAHLAPGQGAEAMIVAPATADVLSRLAAGAASDMLSAQALAYAGPLVVAPAMNPRMWAHPATQENVERLRARGVVLVGPDSGEAACGEQGRGRLAEPDAIFFAALRALAPQDMAGLRVMVTLGPTREPWDGVRYWSNPSSGRMGAALAACAWLRGAEVTAICGPGVRMRLPGGVTRVDVTTAAEMFTAASELWPQMDMGFFSAAVADFSPRRPADGGEGKFKKTGAADGLSLSFTPNADILRTLAASRRPGQRVLGFAAEIVPDMASLLDLARLKLASKDADMVAANPVNAGHGAFGAAEASMAVVDRSGHEEIWNARSKADIAWDLCSWLLRI